MQPDSGLRKTTSNESRKTMFHSNIVNLKTPHINFQRKKQSPQQTEKAKGKVQNNTNSKLDELLFGTDMNDLTKNTAIDDFLIETDDMQRKLSENFEHELLANINKKSAHLS